MAKSAANKSIVLRPYLPFRCWLISYIFDNKKIAVKSWFIVQRTNFTYYRRIRDIQIVSTWWKRWLFNIGDIVLYITDDSEHILTLFDIKNPQLIAQQLMNIIEQSRRDIKGIERI